MNEKKRGGDSVVELDNFKTALATYKAPLLEVKGALDLVNKQQKIQELERGMEAPDLSECNFLWQKKQCKAHNRCLFQERQPHSLFLLAQVWLRQAQILP